MAATKPDQPGLGKTPEAFNAVDVGLVSNEFVPAVVDPEVLAITDINQAVVAAPAIGIDDTFKADLAPNNLLQRGLRTIGHNLSIDAAIALEDAEDDGFSVGTSTSFPFNPFWTEKGFIYFDLSAEGRSGITKYDQAKTKSPEVTVDRVSAQPGHCGDLRGIQIDCKISQ